MQHKHGNAGPGTRQGLAQGQRLDQWYWNKRLALGLLSRGGGGLTLFYELPSLLIAEVGVRGGPQAEGLPEQDAKTPHVALGGIAACREQGGDGATPAQPRAGLQPREDRAPVP